MRFCEICNKPLTGITTHARAKYCSDACKMAAYRRRKDPQTGSRARRKERAAHAVETMRWLVHEFNCECCGQLVRVSKMEALRTYCSDACKQKAYRQRRAAAKGDPRKAAYIRAALANKPMLNQYAVCLAMYEARDSDCRYWYDVIIKDDVLYGEIYDAVLSALTEK